MKRMICLCLVTVLLAGAIPFLGSAAPEVAAKSAFLMDIATGTVLYENNAHEKLPPASVTKVMTMLLIMEAIADGRLRWEDTVTASENAAAKGGSQIYLKEGETMSVTDMVKSIAVSSANDCACAMAEHLCGSEEAFVEQMNRRAGELGMEDTYFVNCTGLDDGPNGREHVTSAHDIAIMSRQLLKYHPQITKFTTIWMDTVRDGQFGLSNTNKLVRFYDGATGLKTGFTSAAGYCLSASAKREDLELVAVVMGCATSKDRFNACKQLLDFGFANYCLVQPEAEMLSVPVKLGQEKQVRAIPGQEPQFLIEKAQKSSIRITTQLEETVSAPVSKGQRLGTMTVYSGEQILAQIPLVAENTVAKRTFGALFLDMLKQLCCTK